MFQYVKRAVLGSVISLMPSLAHADLSSLNAPAYNCLPQAKVAMQRAVGQREILSWDGFLSRIENPQGSNAAALSIDDAARNYVKAVQFAKSLPLGPTAIEIGTLQMIIQTTVVGALLGNDVPEPTEEDRRLMNYLIFVNNAIVREGEAGLMVSLAARDLGSVMERESARCPLYNLSQATVVDKQIIGFMQGTEGIVVPRANAPLADHQGYREAFNRYLAPLSDPALDLVQVPSILQSGVGGVVRLTGVSGAVRRPVDAPAYSNLTLRGSFLQWTPCTNAQGEEVGPYFAVLPAVAGILPETCDAVLEGGRCLVVLSAPNRAVAGGVNFSRSLRTSFTPRVGASNGEVSQAWLTYTRPIMRDTQFSCGVGIPR